MGANYECLILDFEWEDLSAVAGKMPALVRLRAHTISEVKVLINKG
ncbi:hypothetical protein LNTAR_10626 [Lentisphaera araneosa HTCC2155]|uniref:Uncharacterized protein n=1 Tax=Lentisphaera araneosa HTCC2155 TaxID=313628 RepID=A6DIS8_9BACT|nr:hypothetical protein LNTAR_10626 [Lentisphaera araneosa HTCC2155]